MPLVHEIYKSGTVPIVSRTLISLYIEVVECNGSIAAIDLHRVSENDARVDTNQLWIGQLDGTSNFILIYNMLIEYNKAGIVTNEPSDTTSDVSGEEMSEVAKGKQRQVDTPEPTGNPPTAALETSSVAPGKRKRVDNPENPGVEPVQRVRTVHM